jgi:hypothetical protein
VATHSSYHAETLRRSHRYEERRRGFIRRVLWHWLAALVLLGFTAYQLGGIVELGPRAVLLVACWIGWILAWPRSPHGR